MARHPDARNRGQIINRGDRKYLIRVYLGRDGAGKRKYSSKVYEGPYKSAEQELTRMLREVDTQSFVEPSKLTVREYLGSFLDGKTNVKPRTLRGYREQATYNIYPLLGDYRVDQLSKAVIEKAWGELLKAGKSPRSVHLAHRVLSPALKALVQEQKLARNPCDLVTLPRIPKDEQLVMTPEEVSKFLQVTHSHEMYPLWALLLSTGLRPSEALGVTWEDLDADARTLRIQRAVTEDAEGHLIVDTTKTEGSKRLMSLPETVVQDLLAHRSKQVVQMLKAGKRYDRSGNWVFANDVGHLWDLTAIRKRWKSCLVKAGLRKELRLYDARHTHATLLLAAKVNPKVVSERLGHSSINLTMNTYSHVIPEIQRETADTVERLLFTPASKVGT